MPYLSNISHPNNNTQEKVNYFFDYFSLSNMRIGKLPRFNLFCPSYCFQSILFQLETNRFNCTPYVKNLLGALTKYDIELIESIILDRRKIDRLRLLLNFSYKQLSNEIRKNYKSLKRFIIAITNEIENEELSKVINLITQFLSCNHKLISHRRQLEYLATILVSIFRLEGFDRLETERNFKSSFSNSIHDFPFPESITQIEKKDERKKAKEAFINQRSFAQQFQAIKDSVKRKELSQKIIFRLKNIKPEDGLVVDFSYNNFRIISQNHPWAKEIRSAIKKDVIRNSFFNSDDFILAIFDMSTKFSSTRIRELVTDPLNSLCKYINHRVNRVSKNKSIAVADLSQYLVTINFDDFGSGWSSNKNVIELKNFDHNLLQDNAFEDLSDVHNGLKRKILFFEDLFWSGIADNDPVKHWIYLENMTPPPPNGKRLVRQTVSSILMYKYKSFVNNNYITDFNNLIDIFSPSKRIGFSKEELQKYRNRDYDSIDVYKATRPSQNPFVRRLGGICKTDKQLVCQIAYYNFIDSILIEAASFRNMFLHSGFVNEKLRIRLENMLPVVISRFRQNCIWMVSSQSRRKNFDKLLLSKISSKRKFEREALLKNKPGRLPGIDF